ncbi:MAG: T9SS type A sorting domain-containing protein [Ignavibacteriae bacterium]|nr:T9SS type A sorting domain-containing protein [Ignavibacteriota bacterium]
MTMSYRLFLTFVLLITAAHTGVSSESSIDLSFYNSATGVAVKPDRVQLIANHDGETQMLSGDQLHTFNPTIISLPLGTWNVAIEADGFRSISSHIEVEANAQSSYEFFLDPLIAPAELRAIDTQRRNDATLVLGYVVDRTSGVPLKNVTIRIAGGAEIQTDERGFFQTSLPINSSTPHLSFAKSGYITERRMNIETWPGGDWIFTIRLQPGFGTNIIDESKDHKQSSESPIDTCATCETENTISSPPLLTTVLLPASIRVGRSCTGTSCTTVEVYSLDTYCKHVLPAEWYSCWGSLSNGMNSLQAGAVSIRSYGLWYVYNPLRSNYDICDNTSCQVFGSATSTNANNAVDATTRYIVLNGTSVARAEYAAENNNKGCGDGFTGTGTSWPCIADQVCAGQTPNGHGRGVCQWGTVRWANGTRVTTASPCAQGTSHGLGTLTWQQILGHYYPTYVLTQGATATIDSIRLSQSVVAQGSTFSIQYSVTTTDDMSLILAASIAPTGASSFVSDPPRDLKASFFAGGGSVSRNFVVSVSQDTGVYDLLVAVWHDKNNNNIIDTGDFVVHSKQYNAALTISVLPVQLVSFTATAVNNRDVRLDWRTLSEINNYGFYVQRRAESVATWSEVPNGFVAGHGTTNTPHDYTFTDQNVTGGSWLYRLRQVDLDSTQHFTDPVQVSITSVAERTPLDFSLSQNFPNPFNPSTHIPFAIQVSGFTSLRVFDILGRETATLIHERLERGRYEVEFDAHGLTSGVYTYRLESNGKNVSRRMIIIR